MQLFMTQEGVDASTSFSDQVWLHGGFDILSICVLLFVLSTMPVTRRTLLAAASIALFPAAAILYTYLATPFWGPLFLLPGVVAVGFAGYGFVLARDASRTGTADLTAA